MVWVILFCCDKTRGIKWKEQVRGRYRGGRKGRGERRDKCVREKKCDVFEQLDLNVHSVG